MLSIRFTGTKLGPGEAALSVEYRLVMLREQFASGC
jgi:hypothetical protein